jgi:excisionase family DNA binding protein
MSKNRKLTVDDVAARFGIGTDEVLEFAQHFTVADVAMLLKVSDDQVLKLIHNGSLAAHNHGTGSRPRWSIDPADLRSYLQTVRTRKRPARRRRRNRRRKDRAPGFVEYV